MNIREFVETANPEALVADGFDDALMGVVRRHGMPPLALYDYARCVEILVRRDGMEQEDAEEYLEFNTLGAWVGDNTPAFAFLHNSERQLANGWDDVER